MTYDSWIVESEPTACDAWSANLPERAGAQP